MKLMIVKETKKEDARQGSLENIIDLTIFQFGISNKIFIS